MQCMYHLSVSVPVTTTQPDRHTWLYSRISLFSHGAGDVQKWNRIPTMSTACLLASTRAYTCLVSRYNNVFKCCSVNHSR
jgi:hypothetical protein